MAEQNITVYIGAETLTKNNLGEGSYRDVLSAIKIEIETMYPTASVMADVGLGTDASYKADFPVAFDQIIKLVGDVVDTYAGNNPNSPIWIRGNTGDYRFDPPSNFGHTNCYIEQFRGWRTSEVKRSDFAFVVPDVTHSYNSLKKHMRTYEAGLEAGKRQGFNDFRRQLVTLLGLKE